jgi:iron complex outermembrane receptor protein
MLRAPRYTLSLSADWGHDFSAGRLSVSGNVFHSAKVFYDFADRLNQPAYTLTSGNIAWTTLDQSWRVSLFGTNLTNEKVFQQISVNSFADFATYERPREVGVALQYKF